MRPARRSSACTIEAIDRAIADLAWSCGKRVALKTERYSIGEVQNGAGRSNALAALWDSALGINWGV
jgi:hypothetical protein